MINKLNERLLALENIVVDLMGESPSYMSKERDDEEEEHDCMDCEFGHDDLPGPMGIVMARCRHESIDTAVGLSCANECPFFEAEDDV